MCMGVWYHAISVIARLSSKLPHSLYYADMDNSADMKRINLNTPLRTTYNTRPPSRKGTMAISRADCQF